MGFEALPVRQMGQIDGRTSVCRFLHFRKDADFISWQLKRILRQMGYAFTWGGRYQD